MQRTTEIIADHTALQLLPLAVSHLRVGSLQCPGAGPQAAVQDSAHPSTSPDRGVFPINSAWAALPSDLASGLCRSICACLCRSPIQSLSGHVPASPVWSDKVTQLTGVHTKHLVFSSGLLAVTLGTSCCFDWHHSNRFPSCPAFQKRLTQGGRVDEKEQRKKKKIKWAIQWRGCKL